ncbi:MAG: hypothetical protein JXM70_03810 [Pirellulales bacterium]|nr:hypothetical protein [Pirellulales bacterium]
MTTKSKQGIDQSLTDAIKSLGSTLRAAYELAPLAVVVLAALSLLLVWLTVTWTPLMTGSAVILVLILSLSIFAFRGNFGEALLSLVGGLLSVFAYEWTTERYVAFSIAWIGFALFALLIASIKIAAKNEDIYRQAALKLVGSGPRLKETEKRLKDIGSKTDLSMLGPIERADIIRTFAFRDLPIDLFSSALSATESLSVITKCDINTVAIFVADFFQSFQPEDDAQARQITDILYNSIRSTPVPPEDYFAGFEKSRRLVVSKLLNPIDFLDNLRECLSEGVPIDEVCKAIEIRHEDEA